jgi:hypothetical protein
VLVAEVPIRSTVRVCKNEGCQNEAPMKGPTGLTCPPCYQRVQPGRQTPDIRARCWRGGCENPRASKHIWCTKVCYEKWCRHLDKTIRTCTECSNTVPPGTGTKCDSHTTRH